jgi:hypothetical protein
MLKNQWLKNQWLKYQTPFFDHLPTAFAAFPAVENTSDSH